MDTIKSLLKGSSRTVPEVPHTEKLEGSFAALQPLQPPGIKRTYGAMEDVQAAEIPIPDRASVLNECCLRAIGTYVVESKTPKNNSLEPFSQVPDYDAIAKSLSPSTKVGGLYSPQFVLFVSRLLESLGLLGTLIPQAKEAIHAIDLEIGMKYYALQNCPQKVPFRAPKSNLYKAVDVQSLLSAKKTGTDYTRAYARCISRHVHWSSYFLKFISSFIAIGGILTILISEPITYFYPTVSLSIYGWAAISISAACFVALESWNGLMKSLSSCNHTSARDDYLEAKAFVENKGESDNEEALLDNLKNATLRWIDHDIHFACEHMLQSLNEENKGELKQGSVYQFLHDVVGIRFFVIKKLLADYNLDPVPVPSATEQLEDIILHLKY